MHSTGERVVLVCIPAELIKLLHIELKNADSKSIYNYFYILISTLWNKEKYVHY